MKNKVGMVMLLSLYGINGYALADPIASSAKLDKKFSMMVSPEERKVPDSTVVGIPTYPGSQFCVIKTGESGKNGWNEIKLLSQDSYKKVSSWYQKKMKGWHCKEWIQGTNLSCSDKDPGPAGNYDPETFNVVDVLKTNVAMPCNVKGMQTGISIRFQPD